MLDFGKLWAAPPPLTDGRLHIGEAHVTLRAGLHCLLVSGDVGAALKAAGCPSGPVGATQIAKPPIYALAAAPDRALIVSETAVALSEGWSAGGWAATVMDGAMIAFDLEGEGVDALLAQGASLDWNAETPSAAIQFAGLNCLACRIGRRENVRLMVEAPHAPYLLRWAETVTRP